MTIKRLIEEVIKYTERDESDTLLIGGGLKLAALASGIASLYVFKQLISKLEENSDDYGLILPGLVLYSATLFGSSSLNYFSDYITSKYAAKISRKMAKKVNETLLLYELKDLDLLKSQNSPSPDQYVDAVYKGIEPFIVSGSGIIFANLEFISLCIFLSLFSHNKLNWWPLSWEIPLLITHQCILAAIVKYKFQGAAKLSMTARFNLTKKMQESFNNIVSVKIFNREEEEAWKFSEVQNIYFERHTEKEWLNTAMRLLHAITVTLLILSALLFAGLLTTNSGYTFSEDDFFFVASFAFQIAAPFSRLGNHTIELLKGFPEALTALEILEFEEILPERAMSLVDENSINSVQDEEPIILDLPQDVAILFSNVSFSYNADEQVLNQVSLKIMKGKLIAIVGPSGSGKSSIAKMMLGLYKPSSGSIYFANNNSTYEINDDNFDRKTINILRTLIGYVPQKPQLFRNTPLYNLRYAATKSSVSRNGKSVMIGANNDPDSPRNLRDIDATQLTPNESSAIHDSQLTNLFNRDNHIDQDSLSGGELQRIGIARAFLRDPSIYIFDEITSGLDPNTSAEIIECFTKKINTQSNPQKKDTVIIITHQLEKIRNVDVIYFVENGRILFEANSNQSQTAYEQALKNKVFNNFKIKTDISFKK